MSTIAELAAAAVHEMSHDNGVAIKPTDDQRARLETGMQTMRDHGCAWTDADIELFAAGEYAEVRERLAGFQGFEVAQEALHNIFEGDIE